MKGRDKYVHVHVHTVQYTYRTEGNSSSVHWVTKPEGHSWSRELWLKGQR